MFLCCDYGRNTIRRLTARTRSVLSWKTRRQARAIGSTLQALPAGEWQPIFGTADATLNQWRQTAVVQTGEAFPDLALYFYVQLPDGVEAAEALTEFRDSSLVEGAYPVDKPAAPPFPPDYETSNDSNFDANLNVNMYQRYLDAAPSGMDVRYAWEGAGGRTGCGRASGAQFSGARSSHYNHNCGNRGYGRRHSNNIRPRLPWSHGDRNNRNKRRAAAFDNDSLQNPAQSLFLSITGTRDFIHSNDVSFPNGDQDDWVEFEFPNNSNSSQQVWLTLTCNIIGEEGTQLRATVYEGGQQTSKIAICDQGETNLTVDNTKMQQARIHFGITKDGIYATYDLTAVGFR